MFKVTRKCRICCNRACRQVPTGYGKEEQNRAQSKGLDMRFADAPRQSKDARRGVNVPKWTRGNVCYTAHLEQKCLNQPVLKRAQGHLGVLPTGWHETNEPLSLSDK